jgi:hypothetical protein
MMDMSAYAWPLYQWAWIVGGIVALVYFAAYCFCVIAGKEDPKPDVSQA